MRARGFLVGRRCLAPVLTVLLVLTAAGCSGSAGGSTSVGGLLPSTTSSSATASSPPSTPSATPDDAEPVAYGLPRAEYRRALRNLVRLESGAYRQWVQGYRGLSGVMLYLPEGEGRWDLALPGFATKVTGDDPQSGDYSLEARAVRDRFFVRADVDGSPFGADCWSQLDPTSDDVPPGLLQASKGGLPAALSILDLYRPAGRPEAGTTPLVVALSAVGFSKAARTLGARNDLRIPVELTLRDGNFYRATISPSDLLTSLDGLSRPTPEVTVIQDLLRDTAPFYWTLRYDRFGTADAVEEPPASKIIGPREDCERGA